MASLADAVANAAPYPLLAVGSGGSLSAAHFAVFLHERFTGRMAKAVTPLEVSASPLQAGHFAAIFLSAAGRNPDILGSFRAVALREPRQLTVMTADAESPLARRASEYAWIDTAHFDLPSGKDGFLATNSLLAFSTLLARAYQHAFDVSSDVPATVQELMADIKVGARPLVDLQASCLPLWERDDLIVLYAPASQVGAADVESRFSEAALGSVHLADYRNFAHGRHLWLAKRGHSTAVLAFVTDDDRELATQMLRLLPPHVTSVCIDISASGVRAGLASLLFAMHLAGAAGQARSTDPGRPGVPAFGRQIYNARVLGTGLRLRDRAAKLARPIERKAGRQIEQLDRTDKLYFWQKAQSEFVQRLEQARFGGLVLDYDGTLCAPRDRWKGWSGDLPREIERLVQAGVRVGIATGRGSSVRRDLRRELPTSHWPRILVGYHNGAEIAPLSDDAFPDPSSEPVEALRAVAAVLSEHPRLRQIARYSPSRYQLSIQPLRPIDSDLVWTAAQEIAARVDVAGITLVRSGHSLDILAPGVSKRSLVARLRLISDGQLAPVLCIGDRGAWPGNDGALLSEPLALSVDEVSADWDGCWNLASAGLRGIQATLEYVRAIVTLKDGRFRVRANRFRVGP